MSQAVPRAVKCEGPRHVTQRKERLGCPPRNITRLSRTISDDVSNKENLHPRKDIFKVSGYECEPAYMYCARLLTSYTHL